MRKRSLIRIPFIILCTAVMLFGIVSTVYADVGPKPFVEVTFDGLAEDHVYFATLLGNTESYGPYSVPESDDASGTKEEKAAFKAFFAYEDPDGYHFWGNTYKLYENSFRWGYYPPDQFKVALFDASTGDLFISTEAPRYAFETFYTAKPGPASSGNLILSEAPSYEKSVNSFFIRLAVTLILEILIALIFGYRSKKELKVIVVVNIITQVLLNLIMTLLDYNSGGLVWVIYMPFLELAVMIAEAVVYFRKLAAPDSTRAKVKAVAYAIIANLASAVTGLYIGLFISIM